MRSVLLATACAAVTAVGVAHAQTTPATAPSPDSAGATVQAAAAPAPVTLSGPAMTAPLALNPNPISFDAGPLGKVYVSGQLTGLGLAQNHTVPFPGSGNSDSLLDVGNAQIEVQTINGPVQFFFEAGSYTFPSLGTPYIKPGKNLDAYFGALPVAYAKLVLSPQVSIQAGSLPTLIGAEYAFTFQNMNIERGLLWNQEPVISKGVQANFAQGPFTLSVSVNDGFDSDHYNWVSGLASFAIDGSNTIALNGGVNVNKTYTTKFRAPNTLNNSGIFDASYTFSKGPLLINPYFQYTTINADPTIGVPRGAKTYSGAVLAKYTFTPSITVAARGEYVSSSSAACRPGDGDGCTPTNLLYGPGSDAWSLTLTPTYQKGIFFARAEVSYTRVENFTPGFGFGSDFNDRDQVRGLIETGFLF